MGRKRRGTPHSVNCECPQCRPATDRKVPGWNWQLLRYKVSTSVLLGVVVFLMLIVTAVAAGAVGYKLGLDDGYGWQASSSIGFHVKPNTSMFPTMVYRTGNYTVGGYSFVLGTDRIPQLAGTTTGYAQPGGPIYIETDRKLVDIYETCVHERLHRTHPGAPHRWIYDIDDRIVDETCLKLIHRLG